MQKPLITRLAVSDALVVINGADIEQIQQKTGEVGIAVVVMAAPGPKGKVAYEVKMDTTDIKAYHEGCYERTWYHKLPDDV